MKDRRWHRLKSTRRHVERAESRIHRLVASLTLAVRDLPEEAIGDAEQRAIHHHLHIAEVQLDIVKQTVLLVKRNHQLPLQNLHGSNMPRLRDLPTDREG